VQRFGLAKGSLLSMMRLVKCHPMHPGGVDEVPSEFRLSWSNETGQFESASIMRSTPERCP
jgi:putative component of membrane protein insertase Oxa1/YidC/SpoIIIJ protein YidD